MNIDNASIFAGIPKQLPEELCQILLSSPSVHIERIVSRGHCSAEGFWYDQAEDEWVLLLQGQARLAFFDGAAVDLAEGDYLLIPAHCKHRLAWTHTGEGNGVVGDSYCPTGRLTHSRSLRVGFTLRGGGRFAVGCRAVSVLRPLAGSGLLRLGLGFAVAGIQRDFFIAGIRHPRNFSFQNFLNRRQQIGFIGIDQRYGLPVRSGATGSADAMHIIFRHLWQIEIHHMRQLVDIETARGDSVAINAVMAPLLNPPKPAPWRLGFCRRVKPRSARRLVSIACTSGRRRVWF